MNRLTTPRITMLGLACYASLALLPTAQAAYNGKLLVGTEVPDWAVADEYRCSGVVLTPRVVISSADCNYATGYFHRKTGQKYSGSTVSYPVTNNVLGNVSVFITDTRFGGTSSIKLAPIASYIDQKNNLVDGNISLTKGTQLVFFARDSLGMDAGTRAYRQMRVVDAYVDWTNYRGNLSNGDAAPNGLPLIYRSASRYRQLEPDYLNGSIGYFYKLGGAGFNDQDADDAVIFTAGRADSRNTMDPPISYENGAGLFMRQPSGDLGLIGTSFGGWAHVRLSHYWPWVVKTLLNRGLRQDAIQISKQVLGTGTWGENDRKGQVGQIYVYDNPYNNQIEYFRLVSLGADNRYWYFPTNQKDNGYWEYLGTELPNMAQATTPFKSWGADNNGVAANLSGTVFVYNNPNTREVEYFRLNTSGPYERFPTDRTSNAQWTYLGTDLPTRQLKYVEL